MPWIAAGLSVVIIVFVWTLAWTLSQRANARHVQHPAASIHAPVSMTWARSEQKVCTRRSDFVRPRTLMQFSGSILLSMQTSKVATSSPQTTTRPPIGASAHGRSRVYFNPSGRAY